jgi:hypothetical protein
VYSFVTTAITKMKPFLFNIAISRRKFPCVLCIKFSFSTSLPLANTVSVLIVLLFSEYHINVIIQYATELLSLQLNNLVVAFPF